MDVDRDRSAHRVYLNFRTARDRLMVSTSFWLFFYRSHFCTVSFQLRQYDFLIVMQTLTVESVSRQTTYFRQNLRQNGDVLLAYCTAKRSIGRVQASGWFCPKLCHDDLAKQSECV